MTLKYPIGVLYTNHVAGKTEALTVKKEDPEKNPGPMFWKK